MEQEHLLYLTPTAIIDSHDKSIQNYAAKMVGGNTDPVDPVVALNSAHGFTQPLPREGWLSNQCRHLDQSKSDPVE